MTGTRLYWRLVGISIRSQMQYKVSFILQSLGQMIVTGGEFLGIWALFDRFGTLQEWAFHEIAVLYGLANVAFSVADALTNGFDSAGYLIRKGEFDRVMVRPRSTVLLLLGYEFTVRRIGRFLQGAAILSYGLVVSSESGAPLGLVGTAATLLWAIVGAVALFVGIRIIQACVSFKTVQSIEVMNVFTYGGVYASGYPFTIYVRWFRMLFTYGVPLAAVTYYPALLLMGRLDPGGAVRWIGWVSPIAGVAFLMVSLVIWRFALRWYSSTGT